MLVCSVLRPMRIGLGSQPGMHLIEFPHQFTVYRDETRVVIGHVVIETADEEEETCAHCGEELDGFGHCWCMEDEEEE